MAYKLIQAKSISYGGTRALSAIKYIVIHYTGVNNDTALAECKFFATSNTRSAGAHFFVDRSGACYQSIPLNRTAWSVGGFYTKANGAGTYYNICTNFNSVSIELCDLLKKSMSSAQVIATRKCVQFIQSQCPNAKTIIRHWDVNGKACPARMIGTNNAEWKNLLRQLPGYSSIAPAKPASKPAASSSYKVWVGKCTVNGLNVRTGAGTNYSKLAAWPQLGKGNLVDVIGTAKASDGGTWYKIKIANKHIGYVNSNYIAHA